MVEQKDIGKMGNRTQKRKYFTAKPIQSHCAQDDVQWDCLDFEC